MSGLWLDPAACRDASVAWARWADELSAMRGLLAAALAGVQLDGSGTEAAWRIAGAASELASAALFAQLLSDRVVAADVLALDVAIAPASALTLIELARARVRTPTGPLAPGLGLPRSPGDLGGTYLGEPREPYLLGATTDADRGRELVLRALHDTADRDQIHDDEFEIVRMRDGRYVIVLPGVVDLSSPGLGYDPATRTVRDLDRAAFGSSRSTAVADNPYARMVATALAVHHVPPGSELVIVGHSYGADTALDLAADPGFNGPGGYRVSHVVAAGYWSQPQLAAVPPTTDVLVVQNRIDLPVIAESVGDAHVTAAAVEHVGFWGSLVAGDPLGAADHARSALAHDAGAALAALGHSLAHADDLARAQVGAALGRPDWALAGARDFLALEAGVAAPRDGQVVAVFDGGMAGAGHHQSNYAAYLASTDDPHVRGFLAGLGGRVAPSGSAWAIDVSVPAPSPPPGPAGAGRAQKS